MNSKMMLEGHVHSIKERINSSNDSYVLVAQDTTYYNYCGHDSMEGLGKIQGNIKGIMQHNSLVISELGITFGVLGQEYWSRGGSKPYEGIESQKWHKALETVNTELGNINKRVVLLQDREADIFSFFQAPRATSVDLIVRVHQPRNIEIESSGEIFKLETMIENLPVIGTKRVNLIRNGKEVSLELSLQYAKVNVIADIKAKNRIKTQGLSLIIAQEVNAFDANEKSVFDEENRAIWYLLTSLPIENQEDIARITSFYALRWRIERFHYTLKSGALNVEKLQFDDLATTINALAFYSIVAWQLLAITYLTRQDQNQQVKTCFEEKEVQILGNISNKTIKTVKDATLALVKLVGFAPSKKQPMPGIKVLAQALEKFYYIKIGYDTKPK